MKRTMIGLYFMALAGLAPPGLGFAADLEGNYAIWGVGQISCHAFNQAHAKGRLGEYQAYLMGYLTAYNSYTKDTYSLSGEQPLTDLLQWLHTYCIEHQVDSFDRATQKLTETLHETRMQKSPAKKAPKWGRL